MIVLGDLALGILEDVQRETSIRIDLSQGVNSND
jgi:hypothetical protein